MDEGIDSQNPWRNPGVGGYTAMDLNATTRNDELERAIAASLT